VNSAPKRVTTVQKNVVIIKTIIASSVPKRAVVVLKNAEKWRFDLKSFIAGQTDQLKIYFR